MAEISAAALALLAAEHEAVPMTERERRLINLHEEWAHAARARITELETAHEATLQRLKAALAVDDRYGEPHGALASELLAELEERDHG